jgi:thioredoxin-related protein
MKTLVCSALALLLAAPALSRGEDEAKTKKPAEVKKPVYDESADGEVQIQEALAAAKREKRHVLIQWGGNWCSWCLVLHKKFLTDRDLAPILRNEYEVVHIDLNKNKDLTKKYAPDLKSVPYLTVLDADGKVLTNQATEPFEINSKESKQGHDAKKLKEFLTAHQAPPRKADDVLTAALAEAAKTERNVFLHFGAPWCGWCLRLDAWLARPEIVAILRKDFVEVKVDVDRMKEGKEVLARYRPTSSVGIPWFVLLDGKGKTIITSDGPKGNIGFPAEEQEISHFVTMLEKSKKRITDKEVEELRKSLEEMERQRKSPLPPAKKAS